MVGAERFELPTLWSQTRCATRLRYAPLHCGEVRIHRNGERRNCKSFRAPVRAPVHSGAGSFAVRIDNPVANPVTCGNAVAFGSTGIQFQNVAHLPR